METVKLATRRWWYIMPIVFITYSLAYLDRANYGFAAASGMAADLMITPGMSSLLLPGCGAHLLKHLFHHARVLARVDAGERGPRVGEGLHGHGLVRVVGFFVDKVLLKNSDRSGPGIGYMATVFVCEIIFGLAASLIVAWFSRHWPANPAWKSTARSKHR